MKINIPNSCHEKWDSMKPDEKGRYCSICSQSVIDFSEMNMTEIQNYFRTYSQNNICGRFNIEDTSEKIPLSVIPFIHLKSLKGKYKNSKWALLISSFMFLYSCFVSHKKTTGAPVIIETKQDSVNSMLYKEFTIEEINFNEKNQIISADKQKLNHVLNLANENYALVIIKIYSKNIKEFEKKRVEIRKEIDRQNITCHLGYALDYIQDKEKTNAEIHIVYRK